MYATCLFCTGSLGHNESIERFPVGRRLAFDGARGRLWVVCRKCGRWNLSPLEERWEAIEDCERRFRATRLRVSTDEIGLARLADGLELVRIGRPQRPEFAAWRYGDQFGRRRVKTLLVAGGAIALGGGLWATGALAALKVIVPGAGFVGQVPNFINMYRRRRVIVARTPTRDGEARIRLGQVSQAQLVRREEAERGWALRLHHDRGSELVTGDEAVRVAGLLLARLNHAGAFQRTVRAAVGRLEAEGGPEAFIARVAREDPGPHTGARWTAQEGVRARIPRASMARLPGVDRLALEMATNEESERRALEGELAALAAEWRSAEEIAAIADDLLLPDGVRGQLQRLREGDAP